MMLLVTTSEAYIYENHPYDKDHPTIIEPGTHEIIEVGPNYWPCIINGHTGEVLDLCNLPEFLYSTCGVIWSYDGEIPSEGLVTVSPSWVKQSPDPMR